MSPGVDRECTTHHYACDCREAAHKAEIARLRTLGDALAEELEATEYDVGWRKRGHDSARALLAAWREATAMLNTYLAPDGTRECRTCRRARKWWETK